MSQALHRLLALLALVLAATIAAQPAAAAESDVQTAWRLLDYIAVDYPEAVQGGRIVNQLEYDEMVEFSASVGERLQALPAKPAKGALIRDASQLRKAIGGGSSRANSPLGPSPFAPWQDAQFSAYRAAPRARSGTRAGASGTG